ncbi:MAG: hypothetical protein AAFZ99_02315 [Pseudomonadota bacterium]
MKRLSKGKKIVRVTRTGPTCAARYAADLELFLPRQGQQKYDQLPLEIEVSLGEHQFSEGDGFGFSLRFRQVIVEVIMNDCEMSREGRYERKVDKEAFHHYLKRIKDKSTSKRGSVSTGISARLSQVLSALGVEASVMAEAEAQLRAGDIETLESRIDFKIVRWAGAGRWHIGHEVLGDPNELDGTLKGGYISQPKDAQSTPELSPLCVLLPLSQVGYAATVELRARKNDCVYKPLGPERNEERWERKNRSQIEHVLALKMLEEQNRRDGFQAPEGEIILSRGRINVGWEDHDERD